MTIAILRSACRAHNHHPEQQFLVGLLTTAALSLLIALANTTVALAAGQQPRVVTAQVEGAGHKGPRAYHAMCARDPDLCREDQQAAADPGAGPAARLTAGIWHDLNSVNMAVNQSMTPREDIELYGASDFWTLARNFGDCEDFMISKKRALIDAGWRADQLLYAVVEGIDTPYHAVLIVRTELGDFVLDNLTDRIVAWENSGYRFVVRQSAARPNQGGRVVGAQPAPAVRLASR